MPGFDEGAPRGRRSPEIQSQLDADLSLDDEQDGISDPEEYQLLDGDSLMSKITLATNTGLGDAWVTFGVQTRVMQGESEEQAFTRLATITTSRVIDETRAVESAVAEELAIRQEQLRSTRITPRH